MHNKYLERAIAQMQDYVITKMPDGSFSVYKDENGFPYTVKLNNKTSWCDCPALPRARKAGFDCKHIEMIRLKGAWND